MKKRAFINGTVSRIAEKRRQIIHIGFRLMDKSRELQ
jgi:hypothetical protein